MIGLARENDKAIQRVATHDKVIAGSARDRKILMGVVGAELCKHN